MNVNEITFHIDGNFVPIEFATICYFKSYGNYVKIITEKDTLVTKITTNELEHGLPEQLFLRIHKSYIVNMKKIQAVTEDSIMLYDQTKVPIGKTFKRYVKKVLSKYYKS